MPLSLCAYSLMRGSVTQIAVQIRYQTEMKACSSLCLPLGYLKICCKRPHDTHWWKNAETFLQIHFKSRGVTIVQIRATASQASLWLSMLLMVEFTSPVEPRSEPFRQWCNGPATPIIYSFSNSHDSVWKVPLTQLCLGYVAVGMNVLEPSLTQCCFDPVASLSRPGCCCAKYPSFIE